MHTSRPLEKKDMAKDPPKPPVRITNQFRSGQAMVYDLSCEEVRLTIEVTPIEDRGDGLGEWNVGAHTRQAPEKPTIDERGNTRRDALTAVVTSWRAKHGTFGFPTLDWEAVIQALLAVRAI
jgi:hypothetical protein